MLYTRVSDKYMNFSLMYTTHYIFTVLPIKLLINQDVETATPHKLATGTRPSVSNPHVIFCPCVIQKVSAHIDRKVLNMRHQSKKSFGGIHVVIKQQQKWYLI